MVTITTNRLSCNIDVTNEIFIIKSSQSKCSCSASKGLLTTAETQATELTQTHTTYFHVK